MKSQLFPATDRGIKDIGWLKSNFFFSFSDYQDPLKSGFGTLVAFNDDYLAGGKGFGLHAHMNMEIVSVMLKGKMDHIDSMGYKNVVEEGDVQIMSAGSGLRHEEHNVGDDHVNFLQIWISPKLQNISPRYQWRKFPKRDRKNQLVTIVSNEEGSSHCWINQNTKISMGFYDAGEKISYPFNSTNKCIFVFCMEGRLKAGDVEVKVRDAIGLWETGEVKLETMAASEFLIIETPINQK